MSLNYDSLTALTKNKFIPLLVDNIFNSNVLTFKLLKNAEKLDGGVKIITPLEVSIRAEGSYMGFYAGGDALSPATSDPITAAEWNWKQAYAGLYITADEEMKNSGDSQVLSLVKSKLKNAERSLKDLFGSKVFNTGVVGAKDITSLAYTVEASATSGDDIDNHVCSENRVLGGIDSATSAYDWWEPQVLAFAESADSGSAFTWNDHVYAENGVATIVKDMTRLYGACSIDNDQPDLIVTSQIIYDAYESSIQANKRFEGSATLADAGFQSLRFKGASVVVDSHCPAGHMYMLNTKYLDFKVHSQRNFSFEGFRARESYDGNIARIFWMGNLACTNARMQGVLKGGATAY